MLSSLNFVQPDVTLRLDLSGVIRRASLSNAIRAEEITDWVGRPWADTVADDGNEQVQKMLADARTAGVSSFHQVRQRFPSGLELSVEYATVQLGKEDGLIAIGRNLEAVADLRSRLLAAQKSMERDYWKLREVETRYRLLFDASAQPVLLISVDDTRILEANPAAIRALGVTGDRELLPELLASQRSPFMSMLTRAREQGKAPGIILQLGPDRQPWLVRVSLIAAEPSAVFILQLSSVNVAPPLVEKIEKAKPDELVKLAGTSKLNELIFALPEGFVVLDAQGKISRTNRAFLELIGQASESNVLGQRMSRWMSRSGSDANVLFEMLQSKRAVSCFRTTIQRDQASPIDVEVSAAGNADSHSTCFGMLLRPVRNQGDASSPFLLRPQIELVGQLPLREIVQETVSSVERRCIEAAIEMSGGNRTAAAEMLGLSRQSLYSKLSRYSLDLHEQTGTEQQSGD